jgi:hypothetical protein
MRGATGQLPKQPAVDGAEGEFAATGRRPRAGNVVEYPGELGGGEIGVEHQAGAFAQRVGDAAFRKPCARRGGAPVLPDDGVAQRLPVRRFQTTVVSRWLVMPMAAISVAAAPAPESASCAVANWLLQISIGSCSTQPGRGNNWRNSRCAMATIRPPESKTMLRELDVPWSRASR